MPERFDLHILRDGVLEDCILEFDEFYDSTGNIASKHGYKYITEVTVLFNDNVYKGVDLYPFVALQNVRRDLESENLLLVCNGSRYNAYPPPFMMHSCMALELDRPGLSYVNIFDPTKFTNKVVNVEDQEKHHDTWIEKEFGYLRTIPGNIGGIYEYDSEDELGSWWQSVTYHDWPRMTNDFKSEFAAQVAIELNKLKAENHPKVPELKKIFEEAIGFEIKLD